MALSKTGRFLSKAEILGVGVFSPLPIVSQNVFVLVFMGIAQYLRDMLQNGVSHRCACVKLSTKGGVSHHDGEVSKR